MTREDAVNLIFQWLWFGLGVLLIFASVRDDDFRMVMSGLSLIAISYLGAIYGALRRGK